VSVSVAFVSNLATTQTLEGDFISSADSTVTINGLDENGTTYTASTSVPVTKATAYEIALSSGTATIDLTALEGLTPEETIDGTGLKVQFVKFKNKSTNANIITVVKGASNGYGLDASGTAFTLVLSPGQSATYSLNEAAPNVAAGARTWDVTGTGAQVLQMHVILG
jgi:hypothetical protein